MTNYERQTTREIPIGKDGLMLPFWVTNQNNGFALSFLLVDKKS